MEISIKEFQQLADDKTRGAVRIAELERQLAERTSECEQCAAGDSFSVELHHAVGGEDQGVREAAEEPRSLRMHIEAESRDFWYTR